MPDARYRILYSQKGSDVSDDEEFQEKEKPRVCQSRHKSERLAMLLLGLRQFLLLIWKGAVLRRRHYVVTLFEIAIPLLVVSLYVWLRTEIDPEAGRHKSPAVNFTPFNPFEFRNYELRDTVFLYTPDTAAAKELTTAAVNKLGSSSRDSTTRRIQGVPTEQTLQGIVHDLMGNASAYYLRIFGLVYLDIGLDKNHLDYKIRTNIDFKTTQTFPTLSLGGPSRSEDYKGSNFLAVQAAVDAAYIETKLGQPLQNVDLQMLRFPYPSYYNMSSLQLYISFMSMVIIYGLSITMVVFVKRIVDEKVNRAKEMMRMMGLTDLIYWAGTFTNTFLLVMVVLTLTSILFSIPVSRGQGVIIYSDTFLLWVIMLVYAANSLLYCMAISTVVNKPSMATIVTCIAWSASYSVPHFLLDPPGEDRYDRTPLGTKLATCLLPNVALHWALRIMAFYEGIGVGSNWSNFHQPPPGDNLSLTIVMAMMLVSCLLYMFLTFYLDNVWPWQFGIPKHPLFLFKPSYWCPKMSRSRDDHILDSLDRAYFEEDPKDKKPGIIISHLTKSFGWGSSRKVAVNDVSLKMYHGEITALLGHNGAGKTTTMNVITGLFPPTSGTAIVNGYDILDSLKQARTSLGLCPQHNVLYDNMTVEEHLVFFAGLKGRSFSAMKPEITSCLEMLQLQHKRHEVTKTLSGGMKRKLSLGIAMIGGSEVLVLDEPTSGMDPQARRAIWDLLQQIRTDRTIVLTTHYMEEADILGDRIAIMAQGVIQCCGSPLFLKRKFGAGYHLRVSKGELFKEHKLREVVQNSVPSAYMDNDMRTEVSYILPVVESQPFVSMFEALEIQKQEIGYTACGLTITTMEDVFLKVGQLADHSLEHEDTDTTLILQDNITDSQGGFHIRPEYRLTGLSLWAQQVRGLVLKRFHDSRRYWMFLIFLVLLPVLIVMLMLYTRNSVHSLGQGTVTPLDLNLKSLFGHTEALYGGQPSDGSVLKELKDVFVEAAGATPTHSYDVAQDALDIGEVNLQRYKRSLLVGGNITVSSRLGTTRTQLTAMYSGEAYHVPAISLNLMDTALLRALTADKTATIHLTNSPFPQRTYSAIQLSELLDISSRLIIAFFLPLALSFLSASFVLFPIHERQTKSKLLQLMTGVDGLTFWLTHFVWDFAMHMLASCFVLIPFLAMDPRKVYSSSSRETGALFLLLISYGWASIPLSYLLSFISKKPSTGFTVATAINFISGTIATGGVTIYKLVEREGRSEKAALGLRLLPNFAMTWGAANIESVANNNAFCNNVPYDVLSYVCMPDAPISSYRICCPGCDEEWCFKKKNVFSVGPEGCGRDLLFMTVSGLVFMVLLALVECNLVRFWYMFRDSSQVQGLLRRKDNVTRPPTGSVGEDSDVAAERTRVQQLHEQNQTSQEALVAYNLSKKFSNIMAVDKVNFAVHHNECFGLLGVNGAGKTTTFSMLTGDMTLGEGNAHIGPFSVRDHLDMFQRQVGYCPQFDALLDRVTGREALYLFARLRGVPEKDIPRIVAQFIDMTDLQEHCDKTANKYSGGNRRKLSLALALVGSPPMVFLDEPTAGVDPASRRKIWTAFAQVQKLGGTSFILTTHSMEECEALCGRLVIMVNGQFRCLGPIQYLKSKFGQGYTIIVKLNKEQYLDEMAAQNVMQFFNDTFPGCLLKDAHQGMLHYHLEDASYTWSHLFREMERAKQVYNLEDYLISDTTLEQIFLTFAKTQRIVGEPRAYV